MTQNPKYVSSAQLARYAQVDRRTAEHRLTRVGLDPDAHLVEPHGLAALWNVDRLPALLEAIASQRSTPLPLNALLGINLHPIQ